MLGVQLRFSIDDTFPLLTARKLHFKSVLGELLWFVSGSTNVRDLNARGVTIWDEWAAEDGNLGPIYGKQWTAWESRGSQINQLNSLVDTLRRDPHSRRAIVSAWNVGELDQMALPPCHLLFQMVQQEDGLTTIVYQRSADWYLGVPFNIASYSLLTLMVAKLLDTTAKELVMNFGDAHLYENAEGAAIQLLKRVPPPLPRLELKGQGHTRLCHFKEKDFELVGYQPLPAIRVDVVV